MPKTAQHAFKTIESDLSGGASFSACATLLFGAEGYLVDHYERVVRSRYVPVGAEAVDCSRVDWNAGDVAGTVSDIVAACDTLPMISACRVVLVRVSAGDEKSLGQVDARPLAAYAESIPETAALIITAASVPKNSALYKAAAAHGRVYEFDRLNRSDLAAFIRGRLRKAKVSAPPEVVSEIIGVSGYLDREPRSDLFLLGSDVANIAAHARGGAGAAVADGYPEASADRPAAAGAGNAGAGAPGGTQTGAPGGTPAAVTMADVVACMGTSLETDVFAMLDAVSAGRKGDSIELLRNITARGGNAFGLLALLTGQFEIMLGYRELRDKRVPMGEIMKTLGVKSEFRLKKAAGFADRYSAERITELLHRLYRVERDIKSGLYNERLALTMFVAGM
jgi:DNA polymerase-3 subunit delta